MSDLEQVISLLTEVRTEQVRFRQEFETFREAARNALRRLRGEIGGLRGDITALSGRVDSTKGDVKILIATVEELELSEVRLSTTIKQMSQSLDGITQLSKTNYDSNQSILEELTGAKGADRPKRQTRPSSG